MKSVSSGLNPITLDTAPLLMNKLTTMLHINYFVALWIVLTTVVIYLASSLPIKILSALKLDKDLMLGYLLIPVAIFVCLLIIWRRHKSFSPTTDKVRKFKRFAVGHGAILIGHFLVAIPLMYSVWALMYKGKGGHITASALYSATGFIVALPLYLFGIVCLETIRYRIARHPVGG